MAITVVATKVSRNYRLVTLKVVAVCGLSAVTKKCYKVAIIKKYACKGVVEKRDG